MLFKKDIITKIKYLAIGCFLMDRVKRISTELLEKYPDRFSVDFDENKKIIKEIAVVRSKTLRNKIAGYITSYLHKTSVENEQEISDPERGELEIRSDIAKEE
ncbi:MAG: 30S ribosomal protein S17e [Thermoproteota archaeon]|jgi:small subunit ribosomal protein S17e|nr:30S ribosomal protein S17e [Thermoproteota archaeon]